MSHLTPLETIKAYLGTLRSLDGSRPMAEFLSAHAHHWRSAPLPPGIARGEPRQCYANCQRLVLGGLADHVYVEGLACPAGLPFPLPVMHGWLVSRYGEVVDPTWDRPEESTYYGVAFLEGYLTERVLASQFWGSLIDSPQDRHALIRGQVELSRVLSLAYVDREY